MAIFNSYVSLPEGTRGYILIIIFQLSLGHTVGVIQPTWSSDRAFKKQTATLVKTLKMVKCDGWKQAIKIPFLLMVESQKIP